MDHGPGAEQEAVPGSNEACTDRAQRGRQGPRNLCHHNSRSQSAHPPELHRAKQHHPGATHKSNNLHRSITHRTLLRINFVHAFVPLFLKRGRCR